MKQSRLNCDIETAVSNLENLNDKKEMEIIGKCLVIGY